MTLQNTSNIESHEYGPSEPRELSPEAIIAQHELHDVWNDTLYGKIGSPEYNSDTIAVEDLGQRIDQQKVSHGIDGGRHLTEFEKQVELNESALEVDIRTVQGGANIELTKLGLADSAETTVTHRDAANDTVAEVLVSGQSESGRLSFEDQREARDTTIATEIDKALRRGETEVLQHLPASSAKKVAAWLGNIGEKYGAAEFAPNDVVADVGEYVAFSEKVADVSNSETIVHNDETSGEIVTDSLDDVVMRVLDGDPEAAKLLGAEQYSEIKERQKSLESQNERFFSLKLNPEEQGMLVNQIRKELLVANAERLALAA